MLASALVLGVQGGWFGYTGGVQFATLTGLAVVAGVIWLLTRGLRRVDWHDAALVALVIALAETLTGGRRRR